MNRKILNKLLLCTLVLNVASPVFNAAELSSEVLGSEAQSSEVPSEVLSEDTASEVLSENATSEVSSEDATTEEVASEDATTEEVASDDATTEEVASEDATTEEVASDDATTEEVASEDAESEIVDVTETKGDSGENNFYIGGASYIGDVNTKLNETVDGTFSINTFSDTALIGGATITFDAPVGVEISNITITNDETDEVLVEGTDYTLENNVITLTNDLEFGTDLTVDYSAKMLNATTDILGSTQGYYVDHNDNDVLDGNDYLVEKPGFDILVTNDGVTEEENVYFKSELIGGKIEVKNTKSTRQYKEGQISGSAEYTIKNTGDFALEIRTIYEYFDLVSNSDEYYVYGVYSSDTNIKLSANGSDYMTKEALMNSFKSTADEYVNPEETIDVKVTYKIDKESTEDNLDKYNFGSWSNFTKHAKAQFTVDTTYTNNIFGESITNPGEIITTTSLYKKPAEVTNPEDKTTEDKTTEVKTTEDKTTEVKTTEDKTDDSLTQMTSDETTTAMLATTGSTTLATVAFLLAALIVALVAKTKLLVK